MNDLAVLMPVFNEGKRLSETLANLRAHAGATRRIRVFLVDDGSATAVSLAELPPANEFFAISLARHIVNLGQGAALETARQMALGRGPFAAYVTMDSDGQHDPRDLPQFEAALQAGADVVFGNRFAGDSNVPTVRRFILAGARAFEGAITGLRLQDAHNGYRAFSERGIRAVNITQNRMAHATEIKQRVAAKELVIREVPVSIRYTDATLAKGQSSLGALPILRDLLHDFIFGSNK